MSECRLCLSSKTKRNVSQLEIDDNGEKQNYQHIMMSCFGIQIVQGTESSYQLCKKCFKKILKFHKFKLLAVNNFKYLRSLESQDVEKDANNKGKRLEGECRLQIPLLSHRENEQMEELQEKQKNQSGSSENEPHKEPDKVETQEIALEPPGHYKNANSTPQQDPLPFSCTKCDLRFLKKAQLNRHILKHNKIYKCNKCDSKFDALTSLKEHKKAAHPRIQNTKAHFMCSKCSKSFYKQQLLDKHMRTHAQNRPYACPDCGQKYLSVKLMKVHRAIHTTERNFKCILCPKTFTTDFYLRAHVKTHTKDSAFPCQFCGTVFYRPDHRTRHEFNKHMRQSVARLASAAALRKKQAEENEKTKSSEAATQNNNVNA